MTTGTGPLKPGTKIEPPARPAPVAPPREALRGAPPKAHEPEAVTGRPPQDTGVTAELEGKTLEVGLVEHVEVPKRKGHAAADAAAEGEHHAGEAGHHAPAWTHTAKIPMETKHASHAKHATKDAVGRFKKHGIKGLKKPETPSTHGAHGTGDHAATVKTLRGHLKEARSANQAVRAERQGVKTLTQEARSAKRAEVQASGQQKAAHGAQQHAQVEVKQAKTDLGAAKRELDVTRKELSAAKAAGQPTQPLAERVAQASERHAKATQHVDAASERLAGTERGLRGADRQAGATKQAATKSRQSLTSAEKKLQAARATRTERVAKVKQSVKATGLKVVTKGVSVLGAAAGVGILWAGIKQGNFGQMVQGASDIMTGLRDLSSKLGSSLAAAKVAGAFAAVANLVALVQDFQKTGKWDAKRVMETTQHALGMLGGIAIMFPGGQALGAALTAISAGIGVSLFVADHWQDIKGWTKDAWKTTSKFASDVGNGVSNAWNSLWGSRPPPRPAIAH